MLTREARFEVLCVGSFPLTIPIPVNSAMLLNGFDEEDGSFQRLKIKCKGGE